MKRLGFIALWVAATFATALVAWSAVSVAGDQVSERPVQPLSADEVAALTTTTAVATAPTVTAPAAPPTIQPTTTVATGTSITAAPTSTGASPVTTAPPAASTPAPPATAPSTTAAPSTTPTTTIATPTSTTQPAVSTTTSTTAAPTSTTAPAPAAEMLAYQLNGGSVVIEAMAPDSVRLLSATPKPGFEMEVKAAGPDRVEVEFESEDAESEFSARWKDGRLEVETRD